MAENTKENSAVPNMDSDGKFVKPVPVEGYFDPEKSWYAGLDPWQRLNSHYTYSSVRRHVNFKPFRTMKDHLDLVLTTTYQHDKELFPDPIDIYFQPLTTKTRAQLLASLAQAEEDQKRAKFDGSSIGKHGGSRISHRYSRFREPQTFKEMKKYVLSKKLFPNHPLVIGGIKERIHPSSVKLMNSSHHSPQTNAGYVRQDRDGMIFYY